MPSSEKYREARRLQNLIAQTDGFAQQIGFSGTKFILNHQFGHSKALRRPLMPTPAAKGSDILGNEWYTKIVAEERRLSDCQP